MAFKAKKCIWSCLSGMLERPPSQRALCKPIAQMSPTSCRSPLPMLAKAICFGLILPCELAAIASWCWDYDYLYKDVEGPEH